MGMGQKPTPVPAYDGQPGSPIQGDVKRKTLLPEPEARNVFAASSPLEIFSLFSLAA
jgi:hypothetical protein